MSTPCKAAWAPGRRSTLPALLVLTALFAPPVPAQLSLPPDYLWRQLTPGGEAGSSVTFQWRVDPRGEWVVFVGDVELAGAEAVYAMRRNGAQLHRLSAYAPAGSVQSLEISRDGRRVIFLGDLDTDGLREIWSAPLPGAPADAVKLNLPVTGLGVLGTLVPDGGGRVGYFADTASGRGFWSVPTAGPAAASVALAPPLGPDEAIYGGTVMPDGSYAALLIVNQTTGNTALWSAPLAGPATAGQYLLTTSPAGCSALLVAASTELGRIVYGLSCPTPAGMRANQIWSVPVAGPAEDAVSLAGSFVEGGAITGLSTSPDGSRIVFLADKLIDEKVELWSVPFAGPAGDLVRLNPSLIATGDVTSFAISPDGTRVAYIADATSNETFRAWSVPIAGPSTEAMPLVTGFTITGADVTALDFTADSSTVVFRADLTVDDRFDLYASPADGSSFQEQITNDSSLPGSTYSVGSLWRLHPDGQRVVYTIDEDAEYDQRGLGEQRLAPHYIQDKRLNGHPVAGGSVTAFAVFPDSRGTLYRSDELVDESFHLFTVDSRIFGDGFEEGGTAAWADAP